MFLIDIKTKLEEVDPVVYYGMVDESAKDTAWNYIVFNRVSFSTGANKTGYSDLFDVHIIRENFIPEGIDIDVISKMKELAGVRPISGVGEYQYIQKPNTNIVVEMLTLHFVRARKS